MFPLFIGYWTLLVVNNREKNAKYYDPIGIENQIDGKQMKKKNRDSVNVMKNLKFL